MDVAFTPEAEDELDRLPANERIAILNAIEKLQVLGTGFRIRIQVLSRDRSFANCGPDPAAAPGEHSIGGLTTS